LLLFLGERKIVWKASGDPAQSYDFGSKEIPRVSLLKRPKIPKCKVFVAGSVHVVEAQFGGTQSGVSCKFWRSNFMDLNKFHAVKPMTLFGTINDNPNCFGVQNKGTIFFVSEVEAKNTIVQSVA
jgi:hypothetical protein